MTTCCYTNLRASLFVIAICCKKDSLYTLRALEIYSTVKWSEQHLYCHVFST